MTEPIFATPDEVAQVLRVSRSRVYQLIAAGELPSVRFGKRSVRVPLDALRRWADEQGVVSPAGRSQALQTVASREYEACPTLGRGSGRRTAAAPALDDQLP